MEVTKDYLTEQMELLRGRVMSTRLDIANAIDSILKGEGFDDADITPRYVMAKLEDSEGEVYFDSKMTAMFYRKDAESEWSMLDEVELDEEEELIIVETRDPEGEGDGDIGDENPREDLF